MNVIKLVVKLVVAIPSYNLLTYCSSYKAYIYIYIFECDISHRRVIAGHSTRMKHQIICNK